MPRLSTHIITAVAITIAAIASSGAASACHFTGKTKNGERLCSTTYVYKKAGRYDDPSQVQKPAEKCRAECIRDAMKWGTGEQQAAFFNMCKRNKGCV